MADGAPWTLRHAAQPSWLSSDFEDQTLGGRQPVAGSWTVCRPSSWELCGSDDSVALAGSTTIGDRRQPAAPYDRFKIAVCGTNPK